MRSGRSASLRSHQWPPGILRRTTCRAKDPMTDDLGRGPRQEADTGAQPGRRRCHRAPTCVTVGGCALHDLLGQGGMGTVYRATQLALGREVAVKVVPGSGVDDELVARFKREARTAAALEHPHSIPIYAAGRGGRAPLSGHAPGQRARPGRAASRPRVRCTRRARSPSSSRSPARLTPPTPPGSCTATSNRPTSWSSPAPQGEHAYLSDFGLMRHIVGDTAITRVGEWVGSVDYVAPEQIEGRQVDSRADVYALAGVLFTALTGQPAVCPRRRPPRPLWPTATIPRRSLGPGAEAMSAVIARGMAKAPERPLRLGGRPRVRGRRGAERLPAALTPARRCPDGRSHGDDAGGVMALAGVARPGRRGAGHASDRLAGWDRTHTTTASASTPATFPHAARFTRQRLCLLLSGGLAGGREPASARRRSCGPRSSRPTASRCSSSTACRTTP